MPEFRRIAIEEAYRKKKFDRVVELALDGEKSDKEYAGLVAEWMEWRIKAYQKKKDTGEIRKLSYEFLVNYNDIKYYEAYRKSVPVSEWAQEYNKLKKALSRKAGRHFPDLLADILVKEKEFALGPGLVDVAHLFRFGHCLFQYPPGISREGLARRCVHVADHSRRGQALLALPGNDLERRRVGHQIHVALCDASKPLDRRAIEPDSRRQGCLQFVAGDGDSLDDPDHIGEL